MNMYIHNLYQKYSEKVQIKLEKTNLSDTCIWKGKG